MISIKNPKKFEEGFKMKKQIVIIQVDGNSGLRKIRQHWRTETTFEFVISCKRHF